MIRVSPFLNCRSYCSVQRAVRGGQQVPAQAQPPAPQTSASVPEKSKRATHFVPGATSRMGSPPAGAPLAAGAAAAALLPLSFPFPQGIPEGLVRCVGRVRSRTSAQVGWLERHETRCTAAGQGQGEQEGGGGGLLGLSNRHRRAGMW